MVTRRDSTLVVGVLSAILASGTVSDGAQRVNPADWTRTDLETVRLSPDRFPDLPAADSR